MTHTIEFDTPYPLDDDEQSPELTEITEVTVKLVELPVPMPDQAATPKRLAAQEIGLEVIKLTIPSNERRLNQLKDQAGKASKGPRGL